MWLYACDKETGFAMLNDNRYSFSVKGGSVNLTAIRSPYYLDHRNWPDTDKSDFAVTEQGEHSFRLAVSPLKLENALARITRDAHAFNLPGTLIPETVHGGVLPDSDSLLSVDAPNIMLSALKESEDGSGLVLRAWECAGRDTEASFTGKLLPRSLNVSFTPWSVKTFLYRENCWREVDFTEYEKEKSR